MSDTVGEARRLVELTPERRREIEEKLAAHFRGEGCFGEKLAEAFRGIADRIDSLSVQLGIPEPELVSFAWWMSERMSEQGRHETAEELAKMHRAPARSTGGPPRSQHRFRQ